MHKKIPKLPASCILIPVRRNHTKGLFLAIFSLTLVMAFAFSSVSEASVQDEIEARNRQIQELQRQIEQYQDQIDTTRVKSKTLQNEISILNAKIGQLTLEIKSLQLSINQTNSAIGETSQKIEEAQSKMDRHREALAFYLQRTYEQNRTNVTTILLKHDTLAEFFSDLNNVQETQEKIRETILDIKDLKVDLEEKKNELEDKRTELERLRALEEFEKRSLDQNKGTKDKVLKETKGQEALYQNLLKKSKADIEALRTQIQYLQLAGVTAEDAVKYGKLAALRVDIRPAYLIAVLEVESGLGRNVGRCNREGDPPEKKWINIMHTRDHAPFIKITSGLGLNPDTTAVSCPQIVNGKRYGWGGAMGPAQFIPSTWVTYASEVGRLTGRGSANPWNIEDAFMAAAVKLSRGGASAQTRAAEVAASKAYYSGNSKCSTAPCNSYANAIQRKAAEIENNL